MKKIQDKHFDIGEKLPSESSLMDTYKVSRLTIRKAVSLLAEKNLITIQQGKGMFVTGSIIKTDLSKDVLNTGNFRGFYEILTDQGLDIRIKLLKAEKSNAPNYVKNSFDLSKDQKVHEISRLFYVKDLPIAINHLYFSPEIDITNDMLVDIEHKPLIFKFKEKYPFDLTEISCSLEMAKFPNDLAKKLKLPLNSQVLTLKRNFYFDLPKIKSTPLIASIVYLLTDSYQFTIKKGKTGSAK